MTKGRTLWYLSGMLGAMLMLAGDWLLGYVDPSAAAGATVSVLKAGYTGDYALWRPVAAMAAGGPGVLCYLPGLRGICGTISKPKWRKAVKTTLLAGLFGWLLIHFSVSSAVYQFAWLCREMDVSLAARSVSAWYSAFAPTILPWNLLLMLPFVIHFAALLAGKTVLPKWFAFLHPVTLFLAIALLNMLLPAGAAQYALYMGAMNEAMLVFFTALLCADPGRERNGRHQQTWIKSTHCCGSSSGLSQFTIAPS